MFRYDTRNEYWAWFCEDSPAIAAKIASKECPGEAARTFRDHQKLDKGGDSCLCMFCEAMQKKKKKAASRAAALLRELLDSMTPVEARDRAMAEIGGVAVAEEEGLS
jgi:hypothetical protein